VRKDSQEGQWGKKRTVRKEEGLEEGKIARDSKDSNQSFLVRKDSKEGQ